MKKYDVAVIGSGPGGYVAAIRLAQLGLKTVIIEKSELGGICLNWGCIPTKTLLDSAHLVQKIKESEKFGISVKDYEINFSRIIERSRNVANQMSKGVEYLMKKNQIDVIYGFAIFKDSSSLYVYEDTKMEKILDEVQAKRMILALGARARSLPFADFDDEIIIDYKKAMTLQEKPENLLIVGSGAIGVEYADFYNSMGTEVTILEILPQILPNEDEEISALLEKSFKKRGVQIYKSANLLKIKKNRGSVLVEIQESSGNILNREYEKVLIAAGIIANTQKLNLEKVGVETIKDKVKVNSYFQTSNPNIYAIGDCIPTPALAHVASHEGIRAAEAIYFSLTKDSSSEKHIQKFEPVDYNLVPYCTYSQPEVASIGLTEKKAKEKGYQILVGRFPFRALGRARASSEDEGFAKIIIDKKYHKLLGLHLIGKNVTELISEGVIAYRGELLAEDLARTFHAHPTISEAIMEAAANALGEAINI